MQRPVRPALLIDKEFRHFPGQALAFVAVIKRTCVREALQTDEPNPKLEEALGLLEKMLQS